MTPKVGYYILCAGANPELSVVRAIYHCNKNLQVVSTREDSAREISHDERAEKRVTQRRRADYCSDSAERNRIQSKRSPGSALRPGAMSLCPAMSRSGSAARSARVSSTKRSYCASV